MESKHNRNLDILRGIAALTVVCYHLISIHPLDFDKQYTLGNLLNYNFPGHMAVLVFFILSGYVISINTKRLTDKRSILSYIRKRLIRIVPIYMLAMLFTVAITWGKYDWQVILSNFFFISVPFDNVMIENGPAWSLNYELIYYFVFIFFSYFGISLVKTVITLAIALAALFVFFHNAEINPLLISYLIGFLFWATGAMIADIKTWPRWNITSSRIIALFLLIYCLQQFNPYGPVLKMLHIPVFDYVAYSWYQKSISWADLYYYPLTFLLILALTRSYSKNYIYLAAFIYGTVLLRLAMLIKIYGIPFMIREHYLVPSAILMVSLALWLLNFEVNNWLKERLKSASVLGSISYGVYMVHMPIIYFFGRGGATSWLVFALKVAGYGAVLIVVAYLLEEKFQIYVKRKLRRNESPKGAIN
ncbi:MAG: acyltransferase [Flavipsychrobacter sp.]|jgi:peptidoglycan/LPS O-acetylase OafA/YrhL|nr:acyltransferase [Flavipsychrobacter sp.]